MQNTEEQCYLQEINEALMDEGIPHYYESLEDVKSDLEAKRDSTEKNARFAQKMVPIMGSGPITGLVAPGIFIETVMNADATEYLDPTGGSGAISAAYLGGIMAFAYLGKEAYDTRDEIDEMISNLENGNYSEDESEFAYEIVNELR